MPPSTCTSAPCALWRSRSRARQDLVLRDVLHEASGRRSPGSTVITRTMSSSSWYGSSADSGVPGRTARPGGPAGVADRAERRLDRLLDLDVERDRVAAGVEVLLDVAAGLADHQVRVERQLRPAAEVLDGLRAEREVRDEVAVHDVEVDPVGARLLDAADGVARGSRGRRRGCWPRPWPVPSPSLLPRPDRGRLVAALAAERLRAGHDRAARGAGRRPAPAARRPARPPAGRTRRPTSWPRLRRMVVPIPASRSVAAKRSMTGIGLAVQGVWATGFIGMRLTCAWSPRSRSAIASASRSVSLTPPIIVTS